MINRIEEAIKQAMKEKNTIKRDILRMVMAKAKRIAKDDKNRQLTSEDILVAIQKQIKQNMETLQFMEDKTGLKENFEIKILKEFLPQQASKEEVEKFLEEIKTKLNEEGIELSKSIGRFMKEVKEKFGRNVDMKMVNELVRKII